MHYWQILAICGVVLIIAEIFIPGLILLPIGLSFFVTALSAVFIQDWKPLLVILFISQIVILFLTRKFIHEREKNKKQAGNKTGVDAMIGAECKVSQDIVAGGSGQVKLYADEWQALSIDGQAIAKDSKVKIEKIDGNKVIVSKI